MSLVSVVIITYQGVDVIVRAVQSVLNQTYRPLEVIVVDDNGLGSEEQAATQAILQTYIDTGEIQYIAHKVNINGSAARNTGMSVCEGEYIALLDDDDEYMPDKIEKQVKELSENDLTWGMVYCSFLLLYENGTQKNIQSVSYGDIFTDFLLGKIRIGSSLIMFRRTILETVGCFDESFQRHQDWEFIVRVSKQYKVALVNEPLVKKHLIKRNIAKSVDIFCKNRLYYLEKMKELIQTVESSVQIEIYNHHYRTIAKEYLKDKKIKHFYRWINKTSRPFESIWAIVFGIIIRKLKELVR